MRVVKSAHAENHWRGVGPEPIMTKRSPGLLQHVGVYYRIVNRGDTLSRQTSDCGQVVGNIVGNPHACVGPRVETPYRRNNVAPPPFPLVCFQGA